MSGTEPKKVRLNNGGTAVQWRQDGDHPSVTATTAGYGLLMRPNGDQVRVDPGDWIVTSPNGRRSSRLDDRTFRAIYQVVDEDGVAASEAIAAAMRGVRDEPVADTKPAVASEFTADLSKPRTIREAIAQRDGWIEAAAFHCRNEEFYRGIVTQIGEMFGDAAKTSDDGTVQQDVLALKVPDLVIMELELQAANEAEIERLNTELVKCGIAADNIAKDMADEYDRGVERGLNDSRRYFDRLTTQRDTWRVKADGYCQDLRRIQANESTKENPIRPVITFHINGKVEGAPAGWSFINRASSEHTAIVSGLEYKLSEVRRALDRLTAMVNE